MTRSYRGDEPAYAGGPTFCRTDLVLDAERLAGADAVVLGAPFDEGVSYRPGTRFGPRAVRLADDTPTPCWRPHMTLGVDPFEALLIVDHGDIAAVPACLEASHRALEDAVAGILAAGAVPLVLGGDHSLSAPVMRALAKRFGPDGYTVVHFDAHADTGGHELPYAHGAPFRTAVEQGAARGDHIIQIGLRGPWPGPADFAWMRAVGMRWHTMDEVVDRGLADVVADAVRAAAGCAPRTYLTIDVDVLDPAFAPGTGTPVPGGLTTAQLLRAVRTIATELELCSLDIVEVSPPYDPSGITSLAAHHLLLEALSAMTVRRRDR